MTALMSINCQTGDMNVYRIGANDRLHPVGSYNFPLEDWKRDGGNIGRAEIDRTRRWYDSPLANGKSTI